MAFRKVHLGIGRGGCCTYGLGTDRLAHRAHSSTLASPELIPPFSSPLLLPSADNPLACRPLPKLLRFQTVVSITNPDARRRLPGRGVASKDPKATNPYPRTTAPHPTMDLRPRQLAAANDMRDPPLPFSCSFSNLNSNSTSSLVCYSKLVHPDDIDRLIRPSTSRKQSDSQCAELLFPYMARGTLKDT